LFLSVSFAIGKQMGDPETYKTQLSNNKCLEQQQEVACNSKLCCNYKSSTKANANNNKNDEKNTKKMEEKK